MKSLDALGRRIHVAKYVGLMLLDMTEGRLNIVRLDPKLEDAQVARRHLEQRHHRRARRILPDLEAAAALHIDGQDRVPVLGLAARIALHPVGHALIVENGDVKAQDAPVPFPCAVDVGHSDADLLDSADHRLHHLFPLFQ
jgi:hypothetical protein